MPTTSWLLALVGTEPRLAGCARTASSATVEQAAAPGEERAQVRGRGFLAGVRARRVHARIEGLASAAEHLDDERGGGLGGGDQLLGAEDQERRLRRLARGAVHQRQRLPA